MTTYLTTEQLQALKGHTAGPWFADDYNSIRADRPNDKDCVEVASVTYSPMGLEYIGERTREMTFEEWKANTALLAVVPTLLAEVLDRRAKDEAVQKLIDAADRALNWLSSYPGGGALGCHDQVRAAISAVRGRP